MHKGALHATAYDPRRWLRGHRRCVRPGGRGALVHLDARKPTERARFRLPAPARYNVARYPPDGCRIKNEAARMRTRENMAASNPAVLLSMRRKPQ